jgi:para-aminobenzoate synthetase component 1
MPIKGTRPRGGADELRASTKDAAEHLMIVDLERNDLGAICEPGSVAWPELLRVRTMTGVEHLVSHVSGTIREDVSWADAMLAMFPGGSVTGAPKVAAIDHIAALEPVGRGASMGALGRVWPNGDFELALTIRTFAMDDERLHLWVGGGVVWDSDPRSEVEESWTKARPLLEAIGQAAPGARRH